MQRVSLKLMVLVLPILLGCASFEGWMAGSITEGIPKMRKKLPRTVKVHFADPVNPRGYVLHERNRKQVQEAFDEAFDRLRVQHSSETNGCSHVIQVIVDNWSYGDAGFLGSGDRDSVNMTVMLQDAGTERVLTRASLYARDLDPLVFRYVKTLFEND